MYNRLKMAERKDPTDNGLLSVQKQLAKEHAEKELIDTTEVQLDANREKVAETILENQLDKQESKISPPREGRFDKVTTPPLNLLNQAHEQEQLKAFRKAEKTVPTESTEFWDDYVDKELLGQTKAAPSQLHNHPDRFGKLSTDPDKLQLDKVDKMVMASLRDADAMLFHIYASAAGRELTADEKGLVGGISRDKAKILTACGTCAGGMGEMAGGKGGNGLSDIEFDDFDDETFAKAADPNAAPQPAQPTPQGGGTIEQEIERLSTMVRDPNTPHDENWEAAQTKLTDLMKKFNQRQLFERRM